MIIRMILERSERKLSWKSILNGHFVTIIFIKCTQGRFYEMGTLDEKWIQLQTACLQNFHVISSPSFFKRSMCIQCKYVKMHISTLQTHLFIVLEIKHFFHTVYGKSVHKHTFLHKNKCKVIKFPEKFHTHAYCTNDNKWFLCSNLKICNDYMPVLSSIWEEKVNFKSFFISFRCTVCFQNMLSIVFIVLFINNSKKWFYVIKI